MERTSERGGARWVRRGFVLLGCGVVVTVGVSSAMALWVPEDAWWTGHHENEFDLDERNREFTTRNEQLYAMEAASWLMPFRCRWALPVASEDEADGFSYLFKDNSKSIPGCWPINIDERSDFNSWDGWWNVWLGPVHEVRSGVPVAAMRSRRVTNWDDEKFTYVTQCDGLEIPASSLGERMRLTLEGNSLNSPYRPVPLVPVWPGFAVCSVFWAGVVGVVWYVPGMVRGAMRRRRGLCARCGYEVRGAERCPECGVPTGANKVAAVSRQMMGMEVSS